MSVKVDDTLIAEAARRLGEAAPDARVILFGSHARGEAGPGSDLDLLVIEPKVQSRREEFVRLREALGAIGVPNRPDRPQRRPRREVGQGARHDGPRSAARRTSPCRSVRAASRLRFLRARPRRTRRPVLTEYAVPLRYEEMLDAEPLDRDATVTLVEEIGRWANTKLKSPNDS